MQQDWQNFLITQGAVFDTAMQAEFTPEPVSGRAVFALPQLAILAVRGTDAADFLQGQATCDIREVSATQGRFGAFCTPKGRVVCVFFIFKQETGYWLVLPRELLEKVQKRLAIYILRADVQLDDRSDALCLIGLQTGPLSDLSLPGKTAAITVHDEVSILRMPNQPSRYIAIAPAGQAILFWKKMTQKYGFSATRTRDWQLLDLLAGIPWLDLQSSEQYIPQMLNLDRLNGISFNKGCYTGQEIIARTHYKGKSKRQMYLAKSDNQQPLHAGLNIITQDENQTSHAGQILSVWQDKPPARMLVILQQGYAKSENLRLDNSSQDKITLSELTY